MRYDPKTGRWYQLTKTIGRFVKVYEEVQLQELPPYDYNNPNGMSRSQLEASERRWASGKE